MPIHKGSNPKEASELISSLSVSSKVSIDEANSRYSVFSSAPIVTPSSHEFQLADLGNAKPIMLMLRRAGMGNEMIASVMGGRVSVDQVKKVCAGSSSSSGGFGSSSSSRDGHGVPVRWGELNNLGLRRNIARVLLAGRVVAREKLCNLLKVSCNSPREIRSKD